MTTTAMPGAETASAASTDTDADVVESEVGFDADVHTSTKIETQVVVETKIITETAVVTEMLVVTELAVAVETDTPGGSGRESARDEL
ncbi:hypothetical protein V495_08077 [Pseudogymnoascus sp. VKM F-4514 (FW-929)]|nr:hypothetical protein V495_08077 [Pseudogymnoascus sp. VKM F-4514 (FW-929)]